MIDALKKISSPSVANAIETFNVRPAITATCRPRSARSFTELGPLVGYAVTAVIRAEPQPLEGHRASTFGWWDYVRSIPAPRVIVVHDLDEPRGPGRPVGRGAGQHPPGARLRRRHHRRLGARPRRGAGARLPVRRRARLRLPRVRAHGRLRLADQGRRALGEAGRSGSRRPARRRYDSDRHRRARSPKRSQRSRPTSARSSPVCQSPTFTADALKQLYKQIRPGIALAAGASRSRRGLTRASDRGPAEHRRPTTDPAPSVLESSVRVRRHRRPSGCRWTGRSTGSPRRESADAAPSS